MEKLLKKKIKMRELTKNEKRLLTILSIVILILGSYKFIITPLSSKIESLKAQKLEYQSKIDEINHILRKENNINKEWDVLNKEKADIIAKYFPKLDQAQVIYLLNELLNQETVSIVDMSFSRPNYEDIGNFQVKNMAISVPYNGSYSGVVDIIKALKTSPRNILLESVSMDRDSKGKINGNMTLKVYSLDGIVDTDNDVIYIDIANDEVKNTPFIPYEDFKDEQVEDNEDIKDNTELKPYVEEILLDFENKNTYFLPSQELVKGSVTQSAKAKSKKFSLRFEYDIVAIEEENRGFIDVSNDNIIIKYPPNSIGLWLYSYDYSPATVGVLFRGQMGEEIYLPLTKGIGWTGWKYIEANPPEDLNIYPMRLDKLYVEIPKDRDNCGVLLMDKLEAVYTRNIDENGKDMNAGDYIFHVVKRGDTIEKISMEYYNTNKYKDEILKLNEMKSTDSLPAGKILVLKKR
ncbi:LysM peptidoglycan-binding domain-containing protein [Tissierella praeacuta]|uniref:LysM peptidoglycan-binding domain-containing protein n=1 Tax=Tissierella praeacuta TaxID=43131 RepID=UPI001C0F3DB3|nr:LysM domain-containing protein [Tissierella praeacuta]MBU5254900.1 LysM domain-containing protein [Tissierella praeacuta]